MEATLNALRGGRDVLQGMSNAAAGAVSVPVDVLAWALRKAGVPVGDEPVGGSDWMKRKGLTREPENRVAGVIGESIGGVLPMVASAKAPQIAAGVNQMIDNAMAPRRMNPQAGAIVWHGSPHKFTRFDSSKIGTGEGAQAYGHGLYTAEARGTAEEYKKNLSKNVTVNGKKLQTIPSDGPVAEAHNSIVTRIQSGLSPEQAIADASKYWDDAASEMLGYLKTNPELAGSIQAQAASRAAVAQAARKLNPNSFYLDPGYLYKIDLPDEAIGRMLDWDKPLAEQAPGVVKMMERGLLGPQSPLTRPQMFEARDYLNDYVRLQNAAPRQVPFVENFSTQRVTNALRDAGIPGIRYLDQGSRAAGQGTSNYVVFPGNEDLLKILEINDQPVQAVIDALRNKR